MKLLYTLAAAALFGLTAGAARYEYVTVPNDPLHTLQYTLPNGLRVMMSVNKDQPRIQTNIAVRVGGKNDPAQTTGLAHYFEHLMFKGTKQFGTSNYEAEKPMLDQIEQLFETYRQTTDSATRANLYHQIDSISYQASLIAIPNEYDKLMSAIGASGTNAYTSNDYTCYVEDIPSNQVANWAMIQADRFKNPILRGFHTELETIYEEKNMSLTRDTEKAFQALLNALFPTHPYGTQTVLGTQEHLKNPSITNVKNYHKQWYVPNNMAILLSGDFDPDSMVDVITRNFGDMTPNPNLQRPAAPAAVNITAPLTREVKGQEAEMVLLGWRTPGANSREAVVMEMLNSILGNGKCGIIDLNVGLPQRALYAGCTNYELSDGGVSVLIGMPKEGQTLDDVRAILLEQVDSLRQGRFDEELIVATANNLKKGLQKKMETNDGRVGIMEDAFVNGVDWADNIADMDRFGKITKQEIVDAANRYLGPDNYVAVYKRQGKDDTELKIAKPKLTPIATNRDMTSPFLASVKAYQPTPIQPVFLDYKKDLTQGTAKKGQLPVLYKHNDTNDLFTLTLMYDFGTRAQKELKMIPEYLELIGTKDMSPAEIATEFYKLGCNMRVVSQGQRTYVVISGLEENREKAMQLTEKVLNEAVADGDAWAELVERNVKSMMDDKASQEASFKKLQNYATWGGADNPDIVTSYTPDQLRALKPETVLAALKALPGYKHKALYYGPADMKTVVASLDKNHRTPKRLAVAPVNREFVEPITTENIVYLAPYDSKQVYMDMESNRGDKFDAAKEPMRNIYNEYFGSGMNAIVFQEMRESRSLAYSAWAGMEAPTKANQPYTYGTFIATQNDKVPDAVKAFQLIINDMPQSEAAFSLAKGSLDARLRTQRVLRDDVIWDYIASQYKGLTTDPRKATFQAVQTATLPDVVKYQQDNVKDRKYVYAILGNVEDLDMDFLKSLGRVVVLKTEDIFGY